MILPLLLACEAPTPPPRPVGAVVDPPFRVAVIVGYDPADRASDTAEAGAERVAEALRALGWRVELLLGERASAERLREAVGGLATLPGHAPSPEDRLLLYVAAHGERQRDAEGLLAPSLRLAAGSARVSALVDQLDELPVLRKALVLDSCFPQLPEGARSGSLHARSTLVLSAAGADQAAGAEVGEGGIYTGCLLDSLGEGSLLRAHEAAARCVQARRPAQRPRLYPPSSPVFDLALAPTRDPFTALLDGLSPTLPEGLALTLDGEDLGARGGLATLEGGGAHTIQLLQQGEPVSTLTRDWPEGAILGLRPAPEGAPGPDWLALLPEARPRDPVLREIAHASGLSALVAGGRPKGAVAVSLDGLRSGWFVLRAGTWPVYAVNQAGAGEDPRYAAELDLRGAPLPHAVADAPRVLDIDQDGLPEACYLGSNMRWSCVNRRGLLRLDMLPNVDVYSQVYQADLDQDGDLDLLARTARGWEVWIFDAIERVYAARTTLPILASDTGVAILDLDGDQQQDLLLSGQTSEVRFHGAAGSPWATALNAASLGLEPGSHDLSVVGEDGRWGLLSLMNGACSAFFPAQRLRLGPARPGPMSPGESACYALASGDLDLDGVLDLVNVHRDLYQSPHQIFLRRPTLGGWRRLAGVPGLDVSTDDQGVYLDDVDDDGDLDLLALNGEELADLPPEGCCRLYVSDASDHAAHLSVDLVPGGGPALGAEIRVSGLSASPARVSGARLRGAALFGLGAGLVPASVSVAWPDGSAETITDPARFVREEGGYRLELRRPSALRGRLLVGPWIVELAAAPAQRVRRAPGLPEGLDVLHAWPTPEGPVVWSWPQLGLHLLNPQGEARASLAVRGGCDWGGYVGGQIGAMLVGCGRPEGASYEEPLYTWKPGAGLRRAPEGAPAYIRGIAALEDRIWIASRRRRVEEFRASPTFEATGRALPAPEGAVDRTWLHPLPDGGLMVLDQYAGRVEVWAGDPLTLRRLIPVGTSLIQPGWDEARGAWIVGSGTSLLAVDPDEDLPVARWDLPGPALAVLALAGGDLAVLIGSSPLELWVLGAPGTTPRLTVRVPPTMTNTLLSLQP